MLIACGSCHCCAASRVSGGNTDLDTTNVEYDFCTYVMSVAGRPGQVINRRDSTTPEGASSWRLVPSHGDWCPASQQLSVLPWSLSVPFSHLLPKP